MEQRYFLVLSLLIIGIVLISGCIQPKAGAELSENYLKENPESCNIDSDCHVEFSHCGCSNICINIYGPHKDCAFPCREVDSDYSVQNCECVDNECVPKSCLESGEICHTDEECCSSDCYGRPCGPGPCIITAHCV